MNGSPDSEPAVLGRQLIRCCGHAALATSLDGRPYVSLVAVACVPDATPVLLLSDLAQHSKNLAAEPRMSLLYAETATRLDPLAAPRLTLVGRAERSADTVAAARFAARHPQSAAYAGFADFRFYRVAVERGHLVAGFGRISWVDGDDLRFRGPAEALAASESDIVAHMNSDHADAIDLYATRLLGRDGGSWRMTGIDPEGIDLCCDGQFARLDFPVPVLTPEAARQALVGLVAAARAKPSRD
jgi:heme iron utilization protein